VARTGPAPQFHGIKADGVSDGATTRQAYAC
jgi:hypothetical protein